MKFQKYILILLLFLYSDFISAQDLKNAGIKKKYKNFEIAWVPYANYNEVLGTGIGILPMISYRISKTDTISPESTGGIAAMYTSNKSLSILGFNSMYFDQDKWRVQMSFGFGDVHFQTFLAQDPFPLDFYDYSTEIKFVEFGLERKIYKGFYTGLGYVFLHQISDFEDIELETKLESHAIQLSAFYDYRNNVYYPTKGFMSKIKWNASPSWFFNDVGFDKFKAEHNQYHKINDDLVLAWRFAGKFGIGNVTFNQQVVIGRKDLRGYTKGKYRGDGVFAGQTELRWNFHRRMRAVGFAGVATLYGSPIEGFNWKAYPGVGGGMRFKVFKKSDLNVGFDAALGKDDWGLYFRVGEAF